MDNVLIIARDEVVAALLGLLVELRGHIPRFPAKGESPVSALASDQFSIVVVDCDHPDCSELLAEIRNATAQPVLFSPLRVSGDLREVAARHGARSFTLPTDPETFAKTLQL